MNLKDRMQKDLPQPTEIVLTETQEQENSTGITERSQTPSPEQILINTQSQTIRELTADRDKMQTYYQAKVQKQDSVIAEKEVLIQQLSSEKSEMSSTISDQQTELQNNQKLIQSLTTSNDDLRRNHGLMLRKEQTDLVNRNATLEAANHELSQKVNDSNWQSVKKMRDERDKAQELAHKTEVDCTRKIKEAQEQSRRSVRIAEREQHDAEKEARKAKAELKNRSALYIGIWFLTLLCNAVISPQIQSDAVDLFTSIADWLSGFFTDFGSWLVMPYYTDNGRHVYFHDWTGWAVRILAVILLIAVIAGVGILIITIIKRYRQRWCNLTLKYLALMLAIIIIFAEPIRSVIPINLIILFLLSQIVYLPVLRYIDGCFESRQRSDFWEEFQNK